jgi:hypothetical protein
MFNSSDWIYAESVVVERQSILTSPTSFETLVALAEREICDIRFRLEPGRDPGLTHCLQPIFSFELPTVGDRLFNGPYGYRAQYWREPFQGLYANSELITALMPALLAVIGPDSDPNISKIDVSVSLRAVSAKFWMRENLSLMVSTTTDLMVEPWRREAARGELLARWGLWAPETSSFEIKGALIDLYGNEIIPEGKISRHYEIHRYGFS